MSQGSGVGHNGWGGAGWVRFQKKSVQEDLSDREPPCPDMNESTKFWGQFQCGQGQWLTWVKVEEWEEGGVIGCGKDFGFYSEGGHIGAC